MSILDGVIGNVLNGLGLADLAGRLSVWPSGDTQRGGTDALES